MIKQDLLERGCWLHKSYRIVLEKNMIPRNWILNTRHTFNQKLLLKA
jgi:hypothetical protein